MVIRIAQIALRASAAVLTALVLFVLAIVVLPLGALGLVAFAIAKLLEQRPRAAFSGRGSAASAIGSDGEEPAAGNAGCPSLQGCVSSPTAGAGAAEPRAFTPSEEERFCAELLATRTDAIESIHIVGRSAAGGLRVGVVPTAEAADQDVENLFEVRR